MDRDYEIHYLAHFETGTPCIHVILVWGALLGLKLENAETGSYISDCPIRLEDHPVYGGGVKI